MHKPVLLAMRMIEESSDFDPRSFPSLQQNPEFTSDELKGMSDRVGVNRESADLVSSTLKDQTEASSKSGKSCKQCLLCCYYNHIIIIYYWNIHASAYTNLFLIYEHLLTQVQ